MSESRKAMRPGSMTWNLASLKTGESFFRHAGHEGVQVLQQRVMSAVTKLRKVPGYEGRSFTQRVFYAVNPESEEFIKIVRVTRVPDAQVVAREAIEKVQP